jgi:predicted ArsR family transcriptional regulator
MEPLDALVDDGLRDTLVCVRSHPAPLGADEVAAALGVHRTVARGRLERLLRAGLVEAQFVRRSGRDGPGAGRPAKLYAPAPVAGVLELPPRRLASVVARLLDEIPRDARVEALRRVGAEYGDDLAAASRVRPQPDVRRGLDAVCTGLRSLGLPARVEHTLPGGGVITTPDCPLRALVQAHPDAAELDRGMWTALVQRGMRGVQADDIRCSSDGCRDGGPCTITVGFAGQD